MIILKLESIRPWKRTLECLRKLSDEVGFYADENGLRVMTCDESQAAMFDITLPMDCFASYKCDTATSFGIHVPTCLGIARRITSNADIEILIDQAKDKILLKFKKNGMTRRFKTHLINTTIPDISPPNETHNASFDLLGENLKDAVKDIEVASDCVAIKSDPEHLTFESFEGWSTAAHKVELPLENGHQGNSPLHHGIYSLKYLIKYATVISEKQEISMALASKHLNVSFVLDATKYEFYLAHRT